MTDPTTEPAAPDGLARQRLLAATTVVVVGLTVAWHGVRAAAGSWVPTGDDAYFTLRSLDVATSHHPLLGAWSSGSADVDRQVNNLGPLQLDLLAPFTKLSWAGGTAVAVVAVHLAAILATAWLAHRIGGPRTVVATMVGVALLTWIMGSEMLVTPRQHQFLLLTYLCALVAAWAATAGDRWAPLVLVVAGSLAAQTHLSYPILVAALAVPAIAGQTLAWRAAPERASLHRAWAWTAGVGVVLWVQTLVDQLVGWGNFTDVVLASGGGSAPGLGTGTRIVADVLVAPTGYLRPGFATYDPASSVGGDVRVALLILLWLAVVAAAVLAARSARRTAAAGLAVAATAVAAGVLDAARLPTTQFDLVAANYRWLWPTAAFLVAGVVALALTLLGDLRPAVPAIAAVGAVVALLAAVNVPRSYQIDRPDEYRSGQVAVADVTEQLLHELPRRSVSGPVAIDQDEMYFGHPFGYPLGIVVAELGLDYRFEGAGQARRFGRSRVATGDEPTRLVLHHGDEAVVRFGAPDTVAYAPGDIPVSVTLERIP